jgi:uncharacterized repeat protein (TIGR03803 family)
MRSAGWLCGKAAIAAMLIIGGSLTEAAAGGLTTLHNFTGGADGGYSEATVVYHAGMLYGTTSIGGANNDGTVFAMDPGTGAETVLHNFAGGADGASPVTRLLYQHGALYGTTFGGGAFGSGTVFRVSAATGQETVLFSFRSGAQQGDRHSSLIYTAGRLYGTTYADGPARKGAVFSIDPVSGAETVIHGFKGHGDGANPVGGLLAQGMLAYGTTVYGGSTGNGVVFQVDLATGAESVLYSFAGGNDGANPNAALISRGGALFGTTVYGGAHGNGIVFKVDARTGAETILHSFLGYDNAAFDFADGANPLGGLAVHRGIMFGTTSGGVSCQFAPDCGTVFGINPNTGRETVFYNFTGDSGGGRPYAELIYHNGAFYGTTSLGGALKWGTVFKFVP